MSDLSTEQQHPSAKGLEARGDDALLSVLLDAQCAALEAVRGASGPIAAGAALMARAVRSGGRLIYVAAGSSGLMALADAAELPGTFGLSADRIRIHMAGGLPQGADMPGDTEDDVAAATSAARDLTGRDVVIALTASGSTPFPCTFARLATQAGASVIAIANNPDVAIFSDAEVAICLPTPPEVIAGSTRMGAGTAQKATLNMMSTLMGIRLGHVHDGMMVNLVADNAKLRDRAARMVASIAGVPHSAALTALSASNGAVKPAVLLALGADASTAARILSDTDGHLRAALAHL